ncbi:MAG: hypothetical protein AB8U93_07775 [Francisella endosymbiont of Hyalomma scupense]
MSSYRQNKTHRQNIKLIQEFSQAKGKQIRPHAKLTNVPIFVNYN